MPSRKQRKRRQKERRHDYEVVYVDDEGNEVEPPPREEPKRARDGVKAQGKPAAKSRGAVKEVPPPSWQRSGKRALLFFPLFFIVFSLVNKKASVEARLIASLGYSSLFVPLTYAMDRMAHRTYLRRTGQAPEPRKR